MAPKPQGRAGTPFPATGRGARPAAPRPAQSRFAGAGPPPERARSPGRIAQKVRFEVKFGVQKQEAGVRQKISFENSRECSLTHAAPRREFIKQCRHRVGLSACQRHGKDPLAYLKDLLTRLPGMTCAR